MKRIFISHTKSRTELADSLCVDLRNVGHDVSIYTESLGFGANAIEFMNQGLARPVLLIIHSAETADSKWQQREVDAATWRDISDSDVLVMVIKADDADVPPLLRPKIFGDLRAQSYPEILERLCAALLPSDTANSEVSKAFREDSPNPFWRLRAEYFEQSPEQLAAAFSQPSAEKIGVLEDVLPSLIEGSRGTGKTMLLMSLRARHLFGRRGYRKKIQDLFGFYIRLTRGAFCNSGIAVAEEDSSRKVDGVLFGQVTETFSQEFYLSAVESLISELAECGAMGALACPDSVQASIARELSSVIGEDAFRNDGSFETILQDAAKLHRKISEFTKRKFIYSEEVRAPIASFDLGVLKLLLSKIRKHVPELAKTQFVLLLDEYENLFPHQKMVVNDIVKLGAPGLSVKIAKKVGTSETSATLSGQELQEIHDYSKIALVYSVEDNDGEFQKYKDLLERISKKTLSTAGISIESLSTLLPDFDQPEYPAAQIADEVRKLTGEVKWDQLDAQERETKIAYYREAAAYRLTTVSGGGRQKSFAGFSNLAFMSSGVIRYFQEIVGLAYYLQRNEQGGQAPPLIIDPTHQSRAVHLVSEHNLSALSRNVEKYGEQLKYFLLDIGDALRWKVLRHSSEPEAGRLALIDADAIASPSYKAVADMLTLGVREGVFQLMSGRPGMRPKHVGDPQPVEFNISRIFCPVLQFSPRLRWKTNISCKELAGLLSPPLRAATKSALLKRIVKVTANSDQGRLGLEK